jgi:hypothetical protein
MSTNSIRRTRVGGVAVALAALTSAAWAVSPAEGNNLPSIVVAQATAPGAIVVQPAAATGGFPAYQRGVRQAAAEGNEALRRYILRTRMIYDFYYNDFARQE